MRFETLDGFERHVYLSTVALSAASTTLLVAPVAIHRWLFRQHARRSMVTAAHRLAMFGTAMLGLALTGVVLLIFDVVVSRAVAVAAAAATLALVASLWAALPATMRSRAQRTN